MHSSERPGNVVIIVVVVVPDGRSFLAPHDVSALNAFGRVSGPRDIERRNEREVRVNKNRSRYDLSNSVSATSRDRYRLYMTDAHIAYLFFFICLYRSQRSHTRVVGKRSHDRFVVLNIAFAILTKFFLSGHPKFWERERSRSLAALLSREKARATDGSLLHRRLYILACPHAIMQTTTRKTIATCGRAHTLMSMRDTLRLRSSKKKKKRNCEIDVFFCFYKSRLSREREVTQFYDTFLQSSVYLTLRTHFFAAGWKTKRKFSERLPNARSLGCCLFFFLCNSFVLTPLILLELCNFLLHS